MPTRIHPPHRPVRPHLAPRPGPLRRALRLAWAHLCLQIADGHAWNAAAMLILSTLTFLSPETWASYPWLRVAAPIVTALGLAVKSLSQRTAAADRCSDK
jgi:hypothetical protein